MVTLVGSKGVWRGLANLVQSALSKRCVHPVTRRKLSSTWRVEVVEKGGVFELVVKGGGHELKEKEMGDDPGF